MMRRAHKAALALLIGLGLFGCASAVGPGYGPKAPNGKVGYTDAQIGPNRFRVAFAGRAGDTLGSVEDFLLRRAAEITIKAGYTHFVFDTRLTEGSISGHTPQEVWNPERGLLFACPGDGPKAESNVEVVTPGYCPSRPIVQYTATSVIVVLKPEEALRNPNALAAREILSRLAPSELAGEPPA
ncbi:MAG TPA: hypothetical protein VEU06_04185 [Micropepsaceae bacterium]|jgi:hypothetical protein|nr:hypothetical protein [Micropepsaceae bacterium]